MILFSSPKDKGVIEKDDGCRLHGAWKYRLNCQFEIVTFSRTAVGPVVLGLHVT